MDQIITGAIYATKMITIFYSAAAMLGFVLFKFGFFSDIKKEHTKKRKLARAISIALGLMFLMLGSGKMIPLDIMRHLFNDVFQMGYAITFIGVSEFSMGLLLLFPKTFKLAVMMLSVSLGGSLVVHFPTFSDGLGATAGSIIALSLLWLSAVLYAPEMFPEFIARWFHKDQSVKGSA